MLRLHLDLPRAVRAAASPARQAVLLHSYYSMFYSPSISAIAVLPAAPRNGSPVPWLTSLYHKAYAGPYGKRSYPGNCSGELIKDLLKYFRPRRVLDPMTGSGTCADVCRELGIECRSTDLSRRPVRRCRCLRSGQLPGHRQLRFRLAASALLAAEEIQRRSARSFDVPDAGRFPGPLPVAA